MHSAEIKLFPDAVHVNFYPVVAQITDTTFVGMVYVFIGAKISRFNVQSHFFCRHRGKASRFVQAGSLLPH